MMYADRELSTNFSQDASRITCHDRVLRYALSHDASCTYYRSLTYFHRQNSSVVSYRNVTMDYCRFPFFRVEVWGIEVVDKHDSMAYKNIIFNSDHAADKCVGLYPHTITNFYARLYFNEGAHKTVIPNTTIIKINKVHNLGSFTSLNVFQFLKLVCFYRKCPQ